ncbi:hypothetical protein DSM106972_091150 [Dulcicalothrix desertica PCC 7102]|uniref:DUF218 domain-containing protein n=2 Tax=Dulcicalothrix desertica TaxID=32056 RepID=A0A433UN19_9CYAN|nr:hypothetical protein DSM106972_091150 [Dulcicalothrix desertica PCC 7102]TWH40676.1 uncharacterized SAM-binding protein YcdF (DUF218 family) [Dulcicalothrix desertica PCC 7102]
MGWVLVGLVVLISIIPVRLTVTNYQVLAPQAIFVLGGASDRMEFAAQFWQSHSNLDIWVSDFPRENEANRQIFLQLGVPLKQLHLDGRPTDTVTNFTTLADDFVSQKLWHLYLITSDYHMRRSRVIATVVLGSRGIVITPVAVPSKGVISESWVRVVRDFGRSLLWVVTGRTGASFNNRNS